jgi:4-diphosphocytidyl-2-C-methyl-D-erythritol kinase
MRSTGEKRSVENLIQYICSNPFPVISFPNSKINLGLRILRKRSDNYHDLETVFYPLPLCDMLEIIPLKTNLREKDIPFTKSGVHIDGENSNNLCIKAYRLLKKSFPKMPAVQMHLHKTVPAGAGLGGGSSDAAFTLKMLNKEFKLGLSQEDLADLAGEIGSDCPFFVINKPCYGTGRGENLEPVELDLSAYKFIVVYPGIHINTGQAFLSVKPQEQERTIKEIIKDPIERWKDDLYNDFEKATFKKYPEIVEIKDRLYVSGALYASMSGSGSSVYGIFPKEKIVPPLNFPPRYYVKEVPA